jgi:hypothetical protein
LTPSRSLTSLVTVLLLLGTGTPAFAQEASLGSFNDVPIDHWAFLTVEMLVRKYHVMAGFPDSTFRGAKPVTRYELASALEAVLKRMEGQDTPGNPVPKTDVQKLEDIIKAYNLEGLKTRVDALDKAIAALDAANAAQVVISGKVGTTYMDDTQDTQAPYINSAFGINLKAALTGGISFYAGVSGSIPAASTGNQPATNGAGKPPDGAWHVKTAAITTQLAGFKIRSGLFYPGDLFDEGSDLANNWGDAIVGNGLLSPDVSSVRWGNKSVGVAVTRELGVFTASAAGNPNTLLAGISLKPSPILNIKLSADSDQPDWTGSHPSQAVSQNIFALADIGGDKLGISLEGGLATGLFQASAQATWSPLWDVRLGLGAILKTASKSTEMTPGVTAYFPQLAPYIPSLLLGLKEPEIIQTTYGNPGPGSLLGDQAGFTALLGWQLKTFGYPNIRLEYNIQQPVLFYQDYEATFAFDTSAGF